MILKGEYFPENADGTCFEDICTLKMSLQAQSSALLDFKSLALLLNQYFTEFVEAPNWSSETFLT